MTYQNAALSSKTKEERTGNFTNLPERGTGKSVKQPAKTARGSRKSVKQSQKHKKIRRIRLLLQGS